MISKADCSQLEAVWNVIDRCRMALVEQGIFQWDNLYPTRETVAEDILGGHLYVLTSSGSCCGVVTVDTKPEVQYTTVQWATAKPALLIHRLCIEPTAQGCGFGRQLMTYIEEYGGRHRFAGIRLDAYSGNPRALEFYRQRHYREAGQVFFPRRVLPFICFELTLSK